MAEKRPELLFFDGKLVPYADANVHVLTTLVKYAAAVFEGIRAYWNEEQQQLYIFRLQEHLDRLCGSTEVARIPLPYTTAQLTEGLVDLIKANKQRQDLHIRILAFVNADNGLLDSREPVGVVMAAMPMGRYPEKGGQTKNGLDVCISSWLRISDQSMPPRIKAIANYQNSRLALLQARQDGYDDTILLDARGKATEGPGYNLFVVRHGQILTPPVTAGILEGVTRDTLIRLFAERFGVQVQERDIDRTELYLAEEAFFCGSGKEVVPILSVDGHPVAERRVGDWTSRIREAYFDLARGQTEQHREWLTPVYQ